MTGLFGWIFLLRCEGRGSAAVSRRCSLVVTITRRCSLVVTKGGHHEGSVEKRKISDSDKNMLQVMKSYRRGRTEKGFFVDRILASGSRKERRRDCRCEKFNVCTGPSELGNSGRSHRLTSIPVEPQLYVGLRNCALALQNIKPV